MTVTVQVPGSAIFRPPVQLPSSYTREQADAIFDGASYNAYSYIPNRQDRLDILNGQSTKDVSSYLNDALTAAGAHGYGVLYVPPGLYTCSMLEYPDGIVITGAGASATVLQQPQGSSNPVVVATNWANNVALRMNNGFTLQNLGFSSGANTAGGWGLINLSWRARILHCNFYGLGIKLTEKTSNGTTIDQHTNGNRIFDCQLLNNPLGAIYLPTGEQATDTYVLMNTISHGGSLTAASIQVATLSGWKIIGNKLESTPGALISSGAGDNDSDAHSVDIIGNLFDWGVASGTYQTTNYCCYINLDPHGRVVIANNDFKAATSKFADYGGGKTYTQLFITTSADSSGPTDGNIIVGNSFNAPDSAVGKTTQWQAFTIDKTDGSELGKATANIYANMTAQQQGNGSLVWAHLESAPINPDVTAHAGGGQLGAVAIPRGINEITVCATAGDSVKLPSANGGGRWAQVHNEGAASCNVFPVSNEQINNLAANTAVSVAAGAGKIFYDLASGKWSSVP